jgi:hypothetical protein
MKKLIIGLLILCIVTTAIALYLRDKYPLNGQIPGTNTVHSEIKRDSLNLATAD